MTESFTASLASLIALAQEDLEEFEAKADDALNRGDMTAFRSAAADYYDTRRFLNELELLR